MSDCAIKRVFWGWDRPVLEAAANYLGEWCAAGEMERTVLIVPTAEAGRRLRRMLAELAQRDGKAVSVPNVWPPHLALAPAGDRTRAATDLEVKLAWAQVIRQAPPKAFTALVPEREDEPSWRWLWGLAERMAEWQDLLGAGGLCAADVADRAEELPAGEAARWRDLAKLEALFEEQLAKLGRSNPQRLKRDRAGNPWLPEGVTRVVVLAAPDLPPLMTRWLQSCAARGIEVIVAVHADEADAGGFDACGRPMENSWGEQAAMDSGLAADGIRLCADPAGQADEVVKWMAKVAGDGLPVAVGVCDPEITPLLGEKLAVAGLGVFDPAGTPVNREGLWHLLNLTGDLMGLAGWGAFSGLMRIEEVRRAWMGSPGTGVLSWLDDFSAKFLPGSLEAAEELLDLLQESQQTLRRAVKEALKWKKRLLEQPLEQACRAWLLELYGKRQFQTEAPGDRERLQIAWAWLAEVEDVTCALRATRLSVSRQEEWMLVMDRLSGGVLESARGEVDLVLQGWLELLWENAPALAVCGFNEENVPGVQLSHPFLPNSLREKLGLPCQATRFARDACLLTALSAQRRQSGSLLVTLGQWSARDDVRKPSRLLTLCGQAELPARVQQLFPSKSMAEMRPGEPARSTLWPLVPEKRPVKIETISASRIAAYLDCPFRFYLRQGLRMEAAGGAAREMDAMQFGDLAHDVLKQFGEDKDARRWTDAAKIAQWFEDCLWQSAKQRFGSRPQPLVRLQVESVEQRLKKHAEVEAEQRQMGWEIVAVEMKLGEEESNALLINGARFTGKADRIEHNSVTGERRVLDFKTSDKRANPREKHCAKIKPERLDEADHWKTFSLAGEEGAWIWKDVQLPLYAAALKHHPLGPVTQAGYACLPKAVMETQLELWEGFDERWSEAALACAAEVVRRIREGVFWPPKESGAMASDYDHLFPEEAVKDVKWD